MSAFYTETWTDAEVSVVDQALDAANKSGLLVPVDPATGAMRFTHALVANALYAELPPLRQIRCKSQSRLRSLLSIPMCGSWSLPRSVRAPSPALVSMP